MDINDKATTPSSTKKKLISKIHKHYPNLDDKEMSTVLSNIKKFVVLIQRIKTEPQAQIIYKEKQINGRTIKDRIIQTDIEELAKVAGNPGHLKPALEKLKGYFPERKYGRRPKKI